MGDVAAFLAARLVEEEIWCNRFAHQGEADWTADMLATLYRPNASNLDPVIIHASSYDPARVLREVAAKRAILELHKVYSEPERWGSSHSDPAMRGQPTGGTTYWCEVCDYDRDYGHIGSPQEGCETLRHVAAVWSDHPDYDPAWRPG